MEQEQEGLTKYKGIISSDHAYIHQGKAFTAIINTGSIDAAYDIGFHTPTLNDGKFIHWRPTLISISADYVDYGLYENNAYTDGSAVTPFNRNRNLKSTHLTKMTNIVKGATATPAGILIQSLGVGSTGVPTAKSGGDTGAENEIVLLPDTDYVITLTPTGATTVIIELFWYEEEGYKG